MIHRKKILHRTSSLALGLVALLSVDATLSAQGNAERSPYSRFGYGSATGRQTSTTRALGGLTSGLRDGLVVNPANPASYTAVDSMTFIMDLAVSLRGSYLSEGGNKDSRILSNLDYATILFPVSHHLAISAGITPFSTVGYRFGNIAKLEGENQQGTYQRAYSGQGSFNDLYLGIGARLGDVSLGVNGSYLFGYTTHQRQVTLGESGAANPYSRTELHLKGFKTDFGLQYQLPLNKERGQQLVFGATFTPEVNLRSEQTFQRFITSENNSGQATIVSSDTTSSSTLHHVPLSFSFGTTYRHHEGLLFGYDFSYTQWGKAKALSVDGAQPRDVYRIGIGAEWIPNTRGRGLFSRTRYRFGLSGANSYMLVPTTAGVAQGYNELTASFGMGLPLVDRRSLVNIAVDYKYLRPQASGMVREHSIGITIGVLFNENWFRKARIN